MAKNSAEFKCRIVQEYLKGDIGYDALAQKYNIPGSKRIQDWVGKYRTMGKNGLQRAIRHYITYYNKNRIKAKLGWFSPVDYRYVMPQHKKTVVANNCCYR